MPTARKTSKPIKKITKEALGDTSLLVNTDDNESNEDILNGMYFGPVGEA